MGGVGFSDRENGIGFEEDGLVAFESSSIGAQINTPEKICLAIGQTVVIFVFNIVCTDENASVVECFQHRTAMQTFEQDGVVVFFQIVNQFFAFARLNDIGFS